jgi:hypothetical protein
LKWSSFVNNPNPFSLPAKEPRRTTSMSIRLSAQERQAIEALAAKLDIPPSHMARHFLLQVVAFQNKRLQEKSEVK